MNVVMRIALHSAALGSVLLIVAGCGPALIFGAIRGDKISESEIDAAARTGNYTSRVYACPGDVVSVFWRCEEDCKTLEISQTPPGSLLNATIPQGVYTFEVSGDSYFLAKAANNDGDTTVREVHVTKINDGDTLGFSAAQVPSNLMTWSAVLPEWAYSTNAYVTRARFGAFAAPDLMLAQHWQMVMPSPGVGQLPPVVAMTHFWAPTPFARLPGAYVVEAVGTYDRQVLPKVVGVELEVVCDK